MQKQTRSGSFLPLIGSLFLAVVHLLAGFIILLTASWFIAACSVAGLGFNYMLPAVIIRALALIRISSGYFSMLVGHHHLLNNLAKIRLNIFEQLKHKSTVSRQDYLDALHYQSEEVAAIWMAWVGQNAGAFLSLLLLNGLCFVFIPQISSLIIAFSVVFAGIYMTLLWSMLTASAEIVSARQYVQFDIVQHIESASLWHLLKDYNAQRPSLSALNHLSALMQRRVRLASLLLFVCAIVTLCIIFSMFSVALSGSVMFVMVAVTLLSINDWMTPTLQSQKPLLSYLDAKKEISQVEQSTKALQAFDPAISGILVNDFTPKNTNMKAVTASFSQKGAHIIMGSSGAGKSRLLQAINGLIASTGSRQVLCKDNTPTKDLSEDSMLSDCFYSEQFPYILSDTLRTNLSIANPRASDTQILAILRSVGLSHLCHLDEWVGENGRLLSGGEKKRLGLARALLSDANIILLDEPFEALDEANQAIVVRSINTLAQHKIVLIATHILPKMLSRVQSMSLDYHDTNVQAPLYSGGIL